MKHIQTKLYMLDKIIDGVKITVANKSFNYFGLYDGRVRPADQEAKGVLFYTLPELDREMEKFPDTFTPEMHVYLKDLRKDIEEFLEVIKK